MATAVSAQHAGQRLRQLMQKKTVMLPGAFCGLVGRLAAEAGFQGIYVSGGALSALKGVPDIGLLSVEDFTRAISQITSVCSLPVLADADTGFGGPENVSRAVYLYNRAGAAGLHIEDQAFPKRCGHLEGKSLISTEEMEEKIRAAAAASRACSNGDFIICARTDARGVRDLDEAVKRAVVYVRAGADMIFPEGLQDEIEFRAFAEALSVIPGKAPFGGPYLMANMTEFGKTQLISLSTFESLGYHCVIYPVSTLRIAMKAVQDALMDLKKNGSLAESLPKMQTRQELYTTLKYVPGNPWQYPTPSCPAEDGVSKEHV